MAVLIGIANPIPAFWPDARENHRIDADHLAVPIHHRAARVAGINRGVGLNRIFNGGAVRLFHRTNRTHDAARHRPRQAEGISDGIHFLSHLQISRIAEHRRNQVRRFDLDHRQVVNRIRSHDRGFILPAIVQRDFESLRAFDHVVIGKNVPILIDHEPRPLPFLRDRAIEKVISIHSRSNVHHRRNILAVDEDVVLFFAVETFAARGLRNLYLRRMTQPVPRVKDGGRVRAPGGEVEERASDYQR